MSVWTISIQGIRFGHNNGHKPNNKIELMHLRVTYSNLYCFLKMSSQLFGLSTSVLSAIN